MSVAMVQTVDEATVIARAELASDGGHEFQIDEAQTRETDFGWVFFYYPKRYLDTRDPIHLVPGASPLIVRRDGAIEFVTSSRPPEVAIAEYERRWRATRPG